MSEEKFDVVIDVLQKHSDQLWKISKSNYDWGIMDHIRLEQIDRIKKAMACWEKHKHEWVTDEE